MSKDFLNLKNNVLEVYESIIEVISILNEHKNIVLIMSTIELLGELTKILNRTVHILVDASDIIEVIKKLQENFDEIKKLISKDSLPKITTLVNNLNGLKSALESMQKITSCCLPFFNQFIKK